MNKVSHSTRIKIPFHDVDSAHITWHGHYVKYLEIARCELLDLINYNYPQMLESGYFWPVIDLRLRYAAPCRFGQEIIVHSEIKEWENRLKIDYKIVCAQTGQRLTKASTIQVAVEIASEEMLFESPAILFEKLGVTKRG